MYDVTDAVIAVKWSHARAMADTVLAHTTWAVAVCGLLLLWVMSPFDGLGRLLGRGFWYVLSCTCTHTTMAMAAYGSHHSLPITTPSTDMLTSTSTSTASALV